MRSNKAIILANGEFPTHSIPLNKLKDAEFIICCDGSANQLVAEGLIPSIIIGDGDSISPEIRAQYKEKFIEISNQECNDQTKAVQYCIEKGIQEVEIVGATGKREDHTLGNISLLMTYLTKIKVKMYTNYGVFIPADGTTIFKTYPKQQFSIFNFGTQGMFSNDLVYPIRDFDELWQGTLNEAKGERVKLETKGRYLVYLAY